MTEEEEKEALRGLAASYRRGGCAPPETGRQEQAWVSGAVMNRSDLNETIIAAHLQAARAFEDKAGDLERSEP
jgi:hypothetical protein